LESRIPEYSGASLSRITPQSGDICFQVSRSNINTSIDITINKTHT